MAIWAGNERWTGWSTTATPARGYTTIRYTDTLVGVGALPSVGSVRDSYENALAEFTIGRSVPS
jgi:putative transposase